MKKPKLLLLSVVLVSLPLSAALAGNVYKWVDDAGVVHYTDQKPHERESQTINVRLPPGGQSKESSPEAAAQEQERQQEAKVLGQRQQAEAAQEQEHKKRLCTNAQGNLEVIRNNARIKIDEEGGQRFLTPEEILQKRDSYEKAVKENC